MYSLWKKITKPSFRNYALTLCIFYLLVVFLFHSNLDPSDRHGHQRDVHYDVTKKPVLLNALQNGDVVEELNPDRPEVKLDPDTQAARYLKEYKDMYVNPPHPKKIEFNRTYSSFKEHSTCIGEPMKETNRFIEVQSNLHIYSVFWDTRPNDFDNKEAGVYLRIMTVIMSSVAKGHAPLYCMFRDPATDDVIPVQATYYEMCENHGKKYGGYILSCQVPTVIYNDDTKVPPCRIHISGTPDFDNERGREFKVLNTAPLDTRRDFSICVAPLYGDISHDRLIEFMELSSILGATHVTFYDFNISPETLSLLRYFESMNRVTIVPWSLSKELDDKVWYHGQLVSILDCLYRNMAKTKYLAFNDIDEFMVPYNYTNWTEMMQGEDNEDRCAYQFNSVFIDPNVQQQYDGPAEHNKLQTVTNSLRSVTVSRIRTKCMVKPQSIFEAGIHHISKPIRAHLQTIRVDFPLAILHHHRTCLPNFGMNCRDRMADPVIRTRFADSLHTQFSNTQKHFRSLIDGQR